MSPHRTPCSAKPTSPEEPLAGVGSAGGGFASTRCCKSGATVAAGAPVTSTGTSNVGSPQTQPRSSQTCTLIVRCSVLGPGGVSGETRTSRDQVDGFLYSEPGPP